ncbi:hypothetical protein F6455_13595 [Proteobacteria bacterium 005FR1]|nr:hypothetical protein [Proteobacteria bacterium 005FR1]
MALEKYLSLIAAELRKKAWNSIFQLVFGGALIYLITVIAGPVYGCGSDNTELMGSMFACKRGEMDPAYKVLMLGGIIIASLCWGRAASIYEKRRSIEK